MNQTHLCSSASAQPCAPGHWTEHAANPKVVLIDDGTAWRTSIELIAADCDWQVEALAEVDELLGRPRSSVPTCVLIDAVIAAASEADIRRLLVERPELPVIVLYAGSEVRVAVHAMKLGAIDCLTAVPSRALSRGIGDAMERSRSTLAVLATVDALRVRYASLSPREREVMNHVVRGQPNKQTAAEMGISEITVKVHRGRMMRKMAARTVPALVNMAAKLFAGQFTV